MCLLFKGESAEQNQGTLLPVRACESAPLLALQVEGVTGKYWDKCRAIGSSRESYDAGVARRLWDLSAEMVKL